MKWNLFLLSLLSQLLLAGCEKSGRPAESTVPAAVEPARDAAVEAFSLLSSALAKAMAEGGPAAAIPVCSEQAGPIVAEVAARRKLGMVRLSDRPRNPDQGVGEADLAAIETFRAALKQGATVEPAVARQSGGAVVVRLPILISQPLCLQCHGSDADVAPETLKMLQKIYPDDRARGYALNEVRGLWRITVPPP